MAESTMIEKDANGPWLPDVLSDSNAIDDSLEQRIDKWRYGRALGEDNQSAQQKHDDDNGGHPEFLPHLHEVPEIFQKIQH